MAPEAFSRRFKNLPVKRTKRRGLLRNVALAPDNRGAPEAVPVPGPAPGVLGRTATQGAVQARRGREGAKRMREYGEEMNERSLQ